MNTNSDRILFMQKEILIIWTFFLGGSFQHFYVLFIFQKLQDLHKSIFLLSKYLKKIKFKQDMERLFKVIKREPMKTIQIYSSMIHTPINQQSIYKKVGCLKSTKTNLTPQEKKCIWYSNTKITQEHWKSQFMAEKGITTLRIYQY